MDCGYGDGWSVPGVAAAAAYARPVASLPSAACQELTAFLNSTASVSPCGCPVWSRYGGRYLQLGRAERQGGKEGEREGKERSSLRLLRNQRMIFQHTKFLLQKLSELGWEREMPKLEGRKRSC